MAITIPQAGTEINAATFGAPVATEVNRLTTSADANSLFITKRKIYCGVSVTPNQNVPSSNTVFPLPLTSQVNNGFTIAASGITIITPGKYSIFGNCLISNANTGSYIAFDIRVGGASVVGNVGACTTWANMPVSAIVTVVAGNVVTFTVATDGTSHKTDNRMLIQMQWIGD
jgi:hypothetical protein